ncbi:MAG: histidine kinase [Bacteroidales bacterium]|nr:histidine kinase [Bacteroidales bacterium]
MTTQQILTGTLLAATIITLLFILYRSFDNRKKKRLQYALLAFQSHTNPHFIKNVLQAINWFILNNEKEKASDYLCDFSLLMEDILKFSKKNFVTLTEKLRFLDLYLKLQHLRHNDKFNYISLNNEKGEKPTIEVDEEINPEVFLLPPLLIHPYIENAIEHGLKPKASKGYLSVKFRYYYDNLICTIEDNGIGIKASKKMHSESKINRSNIGIVNTKKRIEIIKKLYGISIIVNIEELNPGSNEPGTKISIQFPMPLIFSPSTGMPKEIYKG